MNNLNGAGMPGFFPAKELASHLKPMAQIIYNGDVIVDDALVNNNGDIGFNVRFIDDKCKEISYHFVPLSAFLDYDNTAKESGKIAEDDTQAKEE